MTLKLGVSPLRKVYGYELKILINCVLLTCKYPYPCHRVRTLGP